MRKPLRVLLVEDSENDAELVLREVRRGGFDVRHLRVQTAGAMREALSQQTWDVVLSDYSMPDFSAQGALGILRETTLDLPFIIVSGTIGEETAVEALKAGAHDFMAKSRMARLVPAIERELAEAEGRRERQRAEHALRESEVKYRRIVETTQEGIWVIDAENRTTYVNKRMAEMLGATPDEVVGGSLFDFIDEEWTPVAVHNVERRRQGIAEQHDFKFRRRDSTEFWASLSTNPIADDTGAYVGALAMVTDITEQRKLHEQLLISERMASVGMLAAGVAHEINNPLTTVLGNLDLAERDLGDVMEQCGDFGPVRDLQSELRDAREAANRVRDIVRDLRVFSRTEEDKRGLVDVQRVLESTLRMAWNEIRHRARLVKDYGQVPPVDANDSRLGQVFLNLLVNAAQAIPEGRADANEIRVSTRLSDDARVLVEIRDTGSGMTPDVMRRLFTPFFTTKPIGVGTGLGLSICHRIVTGLGGEIAVSSEPSKGSVFQVYLPPARMEVAAGIAQAGAIEASVTRRGRILVVDDEPLVVTMIDRILSPYHEVATVTTACEALAKIRSGQRFDVILCDLMMPEKTGMDLYRELRQLAPDQASKMIFLTGGAFTPGARAFLDQVQNLRVDKPFEAGALRALVNERIK